MFSFLIGLFLFALDNTIVADVQPAIVSDFQSVDKISWLATAFFMATVGIYSHCLLAPSDKVSDCSDGASFRTDVYDLPCEMVLYCNGHSFRSGQRVVRCSTQHRCPDRRTCPCRTRRDGNLHRRALLDFRQYNRRREVHWLKTMLMVDQRILA